LVLALVIIFTDLLLANRRINPLGDAVLLTGKVADINPRPELGQARAMVSSSAHQRLDATLFPAPAEAVLFPRAALMLNANLVEEVPKLDGFFSLYLPHSAALIGELSKQTNLASAGLRRFLGVSHISDPNRPSHWEKQDDWLPMLTLVSRALFIDPTNCFQWLMSEKFDPREHVLLGSGLSNQVHANGEAHGQILSSRVTQDRVEASIETDQATLLVVSQADYPGWKATLDGRPISIWRANYAFQAVEVPPGRHMVRLAYRPGSFWIGAGLSLVVLLGCVVTLAMSWRGKWHR